MWCGAKLRTCSSGRRGRQCRGCHRLPHGSSATISTATECHSAAGETRAYRNMTGGFPSRCERRLMCNFQDKNWTFERRNIECLSFIESKNTLHYQTIRRPSATLAERAQVHVAWLWPPPGGAKSPESAPELLWHL